MYVCVYVCMYLIAVYQMRMSNWSKLHC